MQSNIFNQDPFIGSPDWGESKFWSYKDLKVHFRVTGNESNPPILLIHGFGASSDHWRNNAEIFASEGFRVFGIDLIFHPNQFRRRCVDHQVYLLLHQ